MNVRRFAVLCFVIVTLGFMAEIASERYFDSYRTEVAREVARDRAGLGEYRRPALFGDARDQNAAVWYRLAFGKLRNLPGDTSQTIKSAIDSVSNDPVASGRVFSERCGEIEQPRVANVWRCTQCNWELGYELTPLETSFDLPQGIILSECLLLQGDLRQYHRDWKNAAESYLKTMVLGCDLGNGDFIMNILGVAITRRAVDALARMNPELQNSDPATSSFAASYRKLRKCLPTVVVGLRTERLRLAHGLALEAGAYVEEHRAHSIPILPWKLFAAWRLSRSRKILERFDEAIGVADARRRQQMAAEIYRKADSSNSQVLQQGLPERWADGVSVAEELIRAYDAGAAIGEQRH